VKIKLLLLIITTLVSVGTMLYGLEDSEAWFSVTKTSSGGIITAGSLDIEVTGGPLRGANLEPGEKYSELGFFCNKNNGTTPLKFRGLFKAAGPSSNGLLKFMSMKVEKRVGIGWVDESEIFGNSKEISESLLYYFQFPDQDPKIKNKHIVQGDLFPGQEACYRFLVKLDKETPNQHQNQSLEFTFFVYATQASNPGWE